MPINTAFRTDKRFNLLKILKSEFYCMRIPPISRKHYYLWAQQNKWRKLREHSLFLIRCVLILYIKPSKRYDTDTTVIKEGELSTNRIY